MLIYDSLVGVSALGEIQKLRLHNVTSLTAYSTPTAIGLIQYFTPGQAVYVHDGYDSWRRFVMEGDTLYDAGIWLGEEMVFTGDASSKPDAVLRSTIPFSDWGAADANVNLGNNRITGLAEPVDASDAATKNYVDVAVQGLSAKDSCVLATNQALPACTYSGVALTLTGNANGALTATAVDSGGGAVTLVANMRILVKNQAVSEQNGIYVLTTVGTAGTPFVLTRSTDANTNAELLSAFTFIENGTAANTGLVQTSTDYDITSVTTKLITWSLFSSAGSFTAGKGLILTSGTVFNFAKSTAYAQGDLFYGITGGSGESAITKIDILSIGSAGKVLQVNSGATAPSWSVYTFPLTAPAAGSLLRGSGGNYTELASSASSILLTDAGGLLVWSTSLPSGTTHNGSYIYRAGGTDVALTDGGTGSSLVAVDGGLVFSNSTGMAISAAGTSGYFVRSGGTGTPTFYNLFGSSNTWSETQNFRSTISTTVFGAYKITTDVTNRFEILANGQLRFGDGSVTPYVILTGANTPNYLTLAGNLELKPLSGNRSRVYLWDDDGSNYISLGTRSSVTANVDWQLPHTDTEYGVWSSDGAGRVSCGLLTPSNITGTAALSKVDDTNVTLTLGGTPATALIKAVSITAGWTGQLSVARGGTGLASLTANAVMYGNGSSIGFAAAVADSVLVSGGGIPSFSGQPTLSTGIITKGQIGVKLTPFGVSSGNTGEIQFLELAANGTSYVGFKAPNSIATSIVWSLPASDAAGVFKSNGAGVMSLAALAASEITGGTALTKVDDTNVTLSLGGSPTTALLSATSLTLGWTGTLSVARGGTGQGIALTVGGLVYAASGTAMGCMGAPSLTGVIPRGTVGGLPTWTAYTMPATLGGANRLLLSSSSTVLAELAPVANRLLSTDGSSVVSWGATLNVARNTSGGIARKWSNLVAGDGVNGYISVTHNLNTRDVQVNVRTSNVGDTGSQEIGYGKVTVEDANTVRVYFSTVQTAANYYVITVVG